MPYKITITKTEQEVTISPRKWGAIRKEYIPQEEFLDRSDRSEFHRLDNGQYVKEIYGYFPQEEITQKVEKEIYSQTVPDLQVEEVIKAVLTASSPKVSYSFVPVTKL